MKCMFLHHLRDQHSNDFRLYTDGSKVENGVAYAIANEDLEISKRLHNNATIFTAELKAILDAVKCANNTDHPKIVIITDSRSSIQTITNIYTRNPLKQEIQDAIRSEGKHFSLCWVPSHIGVEGNERADQLARAATLNEMIDQWQIPRGDLKAYIKAKTRWFWNQSWAQIEIQDNKLREITNSITPLPNTACYN